MNFGELPPELILKVTEELPLHDHARCLGTSSQWKSQLSPALYARLLPLERSFRQEGANASDAQHDTEQRLTRKHVIQWATEHGVVGALRGINETEPLAPFINTMTFRSSRLQKLDVSETPMLLLHLASLHGQHDVVRFLLENGADATKPVDGEALLPIHFATTGAVVDMLVAHGSRADAGGDTTPLIHSLTCHADASAVGAFLKHGADPGYITPTITTAAFAAAESGNVEALRVLLEAGIDAAQPLSNGQHLLWRAIRSAAYLPEIDDADRMIRLILDHGGSVHSGLESRIGSSKRRCYTPYLFVAVMMPGTAKIVQTMLEKGADSHEAFSRKRETSDPATRRLVGYSTAFARSLTANLIGSMFEGPLARAGQPLVTDDNVQKLRLLVKHGCSIDSEIGDTTPLLYSLRQEGTRARIARELIPHLLALGADASYVDSSGSQPLHVLTGHFYGKLQEHWLLARSIYLTKLVRSDPLTSLMQLMIDNGADVNATDAHGRTPLMLLCRVSPSVSTALLIQSLLGFEGIDVNAVDNDGCSALHHILGVSGSAMMDESCWRLQVLLSHSGDRVETNYCDHSGRKPLHLLLEAREPAGLHADMVDTRRRSSLARRRALVMLIRGGADVRARLLPPAGPTPFSTSSYDMEDVGTAHVFGPGAARMLVQGVENQGDTPLHLACQARDPAAMIEVLLRHGAAADVNSDCRGQKLTPLMMLVGYQAAGKLSLNRAQVAIQLLRSAGADTTLRDSGERTAWDLFLELNKSNNLWTYEPYLEAFMPEMPDSERRKLLGLGATERPTYNVRI